MVHPFLFFFILSTFFCYSYQNITSNEASPESLNNLSLAEKKWKILRDLVHFDYIYYKYCLDNLDPDEKHYNYTKGRCESYFYIYDTILLLDLEETIIFND